MKIEKIMNVFELMIKSYVNAHKMTVKKFSSSVDIDGENQCLFKKISNTLTCYIISHDDLDIAERFLQLSPTTVKQIFELRNCCFGLSEETHFGSQKRLKVILNSDTDTIQMTFIGSDVAPLIINLNTDMVTVSVFVKCLKNFNISVPYSHISEVDRAIFSAIDDIMEDIKNEMGFNSSSKLPYNFLDFMDISKIDILNSKLKNTGFTYIEKDTLLLEICNDLNLSHDVYSDYDDDDSYNQSVEFSVPVDKIFSKIIKHVITCEKDEKAMRQLLCLINFYSKLINKTESTYFTFNNFTKSSLAPERELGMAFYSFSVSDLLTLDVGYNVPSLNPYQNLNMVNDKFVSLYDVEGSSIFEKPEISYFYRFMIDLENNHDKLSTVATEYFTNDIDYVYSILLHRINHLIKREVNSDSDYLSAADLELFKMIKI